MRMEQNLDNLDNLNNQHTPASQGYQQNRQTLRDQAFQAYNNAERFMNNMERRIPSSSVQRGTSERPSGPKRSTPKSTGHRTSIHAD